MTDLQKESSAVGVDLAEDLLDALHSLTAVSSELMSDSKSALVQGTIITKIIEAGGLASFLNAIFAWLAKDRSRSIKLQIGENSIEASNLTPDEQQRLVAWFQLQTSIKLASR
jgi:hypothetical protein